MRITRIEIIDARLQPGWNPVFVRLHTDAGLHGTGEMAPAYSPCIPAAIRHLQEHGPSLIGRSAFAIQSLTDWLLSGAWGQPSVECGHAASAVDMALHDLKGKALGVPAYELLGGRVRESIRVYANGWCYDLREPHEYADAALRVINEGFTAMKLDPFRYAEGGFEWAVQSPGATLRARWLRTAVARLEAVREAVGPDVDLLLETHGKFDLPTALVIADATRDLDLYWHEEPLLSSDPAIAREFAQRVRVPVASGERLVGRQAFRGLVENRACAVLQPDLGMAGGLTEGRAIAELGRLAGLLVAPHNAGGPICTAASVHLDLATPNFLIQEIFPFRPGEYFDFVEESYESRVANGFLEAPTAPGLGIELRPLLEAPRLWVE